MNILRKITLCLLLTIVLGSVGFAQVVEIPDANLRAAIADALDIPRGSPITQEDINRLTDLDVRDQGIANLTGLQSATNLTFLQLQANRIEDIRPLANLTQLTELHLGGNRIEDISPLAHLTQLTVLRVNENFRIEDISSLADLTQLKVADLDRNEIVDVSPLARLTNLESLDLRGNRIIDVSPLANLTQLNFLRLNENRIIDITPLENLTNLVALWLSDNRIVDVSPLANLTQLTELRLSNNRIEDVSPLENLTNLEQLDTHNNPIFAPDSPPVEVRDLNLRAAVREALNLPDGVPLTQASMLQLTRLDASNRQITTLTGLEHALDLTALNLAGNNISDLVPIARLLANLMQLTELQLGGNRIEDISPLAHLTQLTVLRLNENWRIEDISALGNLTQLKVAHLDRNEIVDVSPLARLTELESLDLRVNWIIDVSPLANLTQLTELRLNENRIIDVSPLAHLSNLESLDLRLNPIADYSPLDALALSHFFYDQTCEMPPLPLEPRLENRNFPSIFARWSGFGWLPVSNRPDLSDAENLALHDLRFSVNVFGLHLLKVHNAFTISGDVDEAIRQRDELLSLNPNKIHLFTLDVREAPLWRFPTDWPGWIRDEHGDVFIEWHAGQPEDDHGLMDFRQPAVQDIIVQQAIAVSKCGLYDGVMFDYWHEHWIGLGGWDGTRQRVFSSLEEEVRAREIIAQRIQTETRPNFLFMGNVNDNIIPRTGPYVNGGFMETGIPEDTIGAELELAIHKAESSLLWLENNLREPRINALEGFSIPGEPLNSPNNLRWMRALTTLSLTHSDGYVVYSESGVFGHYWYDFWDTDLGSPVGAKAQLYDEDIPGLYIREYTNGWAVYNHSGEAQSVTSPEEVQGVASGLVNTEHALPNLDGEMYLRAKPVNPADVNGDGVVNILDLTIVAQAFGTGNAQGDVNGDGVVNVFDLVQVAGAIGGGGAAPSAYSSDLLIISAADVERWLALAQGLSVGDANFQRGIRFLEGLLAALTPKETTLLPNYPNPFNPETWIPYHLGQESKVAITIYDTKGTLVRQLALGNQSAGYYAERGKAAYWDGRNEDGETVASGIYFYQFRAGDYAASRRMVIVK